MQLNINRGVYAMINWDISEKDLDLIDNIVERIESNTSLHFKPTRMTMIMDLNAVHSSSPLDLDGLLNSEPFDFYHDICGIINNINRTNGKLENCFVPRYSKRS